MEVNEMARVVQDALTVRRVYAEPYEKDGLTVIPAVRVTGGGGGGRGPEDAGGEPKGAEQPPQGEGVGFGVNAVPAGAFVIGNGRVRWVPALDPPRMIGAVTLMILAAGFARGWVLTRQAKARSIG